MVRKYTQGEIMMVADYVKTYFPNARVIQRVRLGSAPEDAKEKYGVDAANRLFKSSFKWADAVVIEDSRVIIIEGKIRTMVNAISQLQYYEVLWKKSEEYQEYWGLPVELWLVAPWFDESTREFAESKGIKCVEFVPDWIEKYLDKMQHYQTAKYRIEREKERMLVKEARRKM